MYLDRGVDRRRSLEAGLGPGDANAVTFSKMLPGGVLRSAGGTPTDPPRPTPPEPSRSLLKPLPQVLASRGTKSLSCELRLED